MTWSILPSLGTMTNGAYTAPAYILSPLNVTLIAISTADPTQSASATISLVPAVQAAAPALVVMPSSATLKSGQVAQFSTTGSGYVAWTVVPPLGSISNGLYTPPASISSAQTVSVVATNGSATASAVVYLQPTASAPFIPGVIGGTAITPSAISLTPLQSAQLQFTVNGTASSNVVWSLSPPIGTMMGGVYTAPFYVNSPLTVIVGATSTDDPSKTATATVTLTPLGSAAPAPAPAPVPATLTVTPSAISLGPNQAATLTAAYNGSVTTAAYSLSPSLGAITNGVYTAPASIASQQTVIVTAMVSGAVATSTITLVPPPAAPPPPPAPVPTLSLAPVQVSLGPSQSQQFSALLTSSTSPITWTLSPPLGTLTPGGQYTAPSSITAQQVVTITASAAGLSANASVTLFPPATTPSQPATPGGQAGPIVLPIEVMSASPTSVSVPFTIPSSASMNGSVQLWLQVHGVKYDTQASLQVNSSGVIPISDTVPGALQGLPAAHYGGVGGGFTTLTFIFNLPPGAVATGNNTVTFYFNGTDGSNSGYRVLGFNILAGGTQLIPQSSFTWDDPNTWQPPFNDAANIAAGQALYTSAQLTSPGVGGIRAHCGDCHTQDGRDLKYFNFSNNSIIVRSQFHGLSAQQGQQIASYIRSLNQPNPGRPWNPPYQPGPGLDSQPVQNWAAGAGLSAVLNNDSDMQPYLMPGGSTAGWAATAYLNARELPLAFQLPDWNSWLPKIHPLDAFGATFTNSACAADYTRLAGELQPNSASSYQNALSDFPKFMVDCQQTLIWPIENNIGTWNATLSTEIYSAALWEMVKFWEINQQNGLEGMPQVAFGAKANLRGWDSGQPFNTAPFILHIPPGPGIGNGTGEAFNYLSEVWYLVQLILNDGQGQQSDHNPVDYIYSQGRVNDLSNSANSAPEAMLMLEWLIKALQEETLNGNGPDVPMQNGGFMPGAVTPYYLMQPTSQYLIWGAFPLSTETSYIAAYTQAWFSKIATFTPAQYYAGGYASPSEDPQLDAYNNNLASFGGLMWYTLPRMRYLGVDSNLVNQVTSWASNLWPVANWSLNSTAVCVNLSHCTSDGP